MVQKRLCECLIQLKQKIWTDEFWKWVNLMLSWIKRQEKTAKPVKRHANLEHICPIKTSQIHQQIHCEYLIYCIAQP